MSLENGMESTPVNETPGGDVSVGTGAPAATPASTAPASSGQSQGSSATPPAQAPGGIEYGDAGLDDNPPPPRERDPRTGRYVTKTAAEVQAEQFQEPAAPVAPAPTQQQDWWNQDVAREAAFYGFNEQEARAFGNSERLQAAFAALDRRMLRDFAQPQQSFQGQGEAAVVPAQPQVAPVQQQPQVSGFDLSKYKDKFDPDTIGLLSEMDGHYQSMIQKQLSEGQALQQQLKQSSEAYQRLQSSLQALEQQYQIQESQRFEAEMDGLFENIAKDYGDIFGKGPIRELAPEMKLKRQEFNGYMDRLAELDMQMGRPPAARQQQFNRALRMLYGDRQAQQIRNQVARETQARKQQGISRPTARVTAPLDPLDSAVRRAEEFYRQKGFDVPVGEDFRDGP